MMIMTAEEVRKQTVNNDSTLYKHIKKLIVTEMQEAKEKGRYEIGIPLKEKWIDTLNDLIIPELRGKGYKLYTEYIFPNSYKSLIINWKEN